ncbi:hypothetical protein [Rhodococcus sp. Q1]|uniref:hypothetical protein n=1 Tax=Rhodococcus TaxID=1827 RepID=UPI0010219E9E|nr:hypothetical protein [Rhodococcus sp. Q1]
MERLTAAEHRREFGDPYPALVQIPRFPRAMRQPSVRADRAAHIYAPHVEPINRLVDTISNERQVENLPYLDPTFGGTEASVLLMLKAPEADADPSRSGARFLSLDNDDPVAARIFEACSKEGIDRSSLVAWNICPFPIVGSVPNAEELRRATPYNMQLLSLLPELKAVVLLGVPAKSGWKRCGFRVPGAEIIEGASPSAPGINHPGNREAFESAMRSAAEAIEGEG